MGEYISKNKAPINEKNNFLVLEDSKNGIICLLKSNIADKFRITNETKKALRIEIIDN